MHWSMSNFLSVTLEHWHGEMFVFQPGIVDQQSYGPAKIII